MHRRNPNPKTRLKTLARAMELGYTAVAYDRTIKSLVVLSDADHRVKIPLFSLQSLLSVAPTIASYVNFHRDLNGVSKTAPLRQYACVTVEVNRGAVGMAFNGKMMGLLRSCYDLVAVKTLDQDAFDGACQGRYHSNGFSSKVSFKASNGWSCNQAWSIF